MISIINWLLGSETESDPGRNSSVGFLLLRLFLGLTMAFGHGWGKLTGFSEIAPHFPDPLGVGPTLSLGLVVFAEFFCSLALALGLATRAAVIPLIITMATAVVMIHGDDPFAKQEKALLYLVPYVAILISGPGRYSLDNLWRKKDNHERTDS